MEIRLGAENLQKALQRVHGIVDRRATMPILSNVLLEAEDGKLVVTATDLEVGARSEQSATVLSAGRAAIPAKHLLDIVRNLPRGELDLRKMENNQVKITSGKARFRIVGAAAEDFPDLPDLDIDSLVELPGDVLAEMILKTQYAVSTDETRYNLNGVFLERKEGVTRMVATDGHRLAIMGRELGADFNLDRGVIIPRKGLTEMGRLLGEKPETVGLGFSGTNAIFRVEGLLLVMRLIDGQFPDYEQVVPEVAQAAVRINREEFLSTLKRVRLVSGDKAPSVRLQTGGGVLTVSSENPDLGEAIEELTVEYEGPDLKVGFNANYLVDVLSVLTGDQVELNATDDLSPGIIRSPEDEGYTAVVMPMRL